MDQGHQKEAQAFAERPAADILAARVGESVVLINLQTDRICELNPTGSRFWELFCEGRSRAALQEQLAGEFDVDPGELDDEIDRLLDALRSEGLITP
jgi:hypothetical protein